MKMQKYMFGHDKSREVDAPEILARYENGQRDFSHFSLCGLSFHGENLSDSNFSFADLIGTSFLGCNLKHAKFIDCQTGQPMITRLSIILLCICAVITSSYIAAFFTVYASSTSAARLVFMFTCFLLYVSSRIEHQRNHTLMNPLPFSIKALFALILMFLLSSDLRIQGLNDGLSFLFSFSFLSFGLLMQIVGISFSHSLVSLFNRSISGLGHSDSLLKSWIIGSTTMTCFSAIVIYSAPNRIGLETNVIFVIFVLLASSFSTPNAITKIIMDKLCVLTSIGNTSFKGSCLVSADFSLSALAGVDFREASLSGVCWTYTKDFELALFGKVKPVKVPAQKTDSSSIGVPMPMSLDPNLPSALAQAKRSYKLVPFVGAGLSLGPDVRGGFPTWRELPGRLLDICDSYDVWLDDGDRSTLRDRFLERDQADPSHMCPRAMPLREMLLQLDQLKNKLGDKYATAFTSIFRPVDAEPGAAHRAIVELNAPLVITTNFDKLIEAADHSSARTMYTGKKASAALADIRQNRSVLFKVHGTAEDIDSVVLTLDEYKTLHADEAYKAVLNHILIDRTFLFVGYGMVDPHDLDLVLSNIAKLLKGATGPHFALLKCLRNAQDNVNRKDKLRQEYNINVITYKDHADLVPFLEKLVIT